MEVEAKLEIDDNDTFDQILALPRLGRYQLGPPVSIVMTDTYYDTPERVLFRNGYCCRLRETVGHGRHQGTQVTLKNLTESKDGIHKRIELEADLAIANSAPTDWPPSEVRELILSLSAGAPLVSLFSLIQQRYQRRVLDAQRLVAEMSLDWVEFQFASGQDHYMVLEIELLPDGTLTDLDNLVSMAKARWALRGMFQSKFQRALALYLRSSAQGTTSSAIGFDTDKTCITGVDGVDRDGSNSCRLLER